MNFTLWILAGLVIGWSGYFIFRFRRGLIASILIALGGALIGGFLLAPGLGTQVLAPGDFNPMLMFIASASALGAITMAQLLGYDPAGRRNSSH